MMTPQQSPSLFLEPTVSLTKGKNDVIYLKSNHALNKNPNSLISYLEHWAQETPKTTFLAQRDKHNPQQWERITFAEMLEKATIIADSFDPAKLSKDHPLMILSGNSIASALVTFACYLKAVPVVCLSPSYSLMSKDYGKVSYIHSIVNSNTVFAESYRVFKAPLNMLKAKGLEIMTADPVLPEKNITTIQAILDADTIHHSNKTSKNFTVEITPNTVAKIYFTSGSTGMPKGVPNTHKMLTSNQEAIAQIWPFIEQQGNVLVDWLPWHHTFGGNHNFNMALRNGCTLYIDEGKPAPGPLIETTINNLKEISPTLYFNVAAGYDLLVGYLEKDDELAQKFFKNLRIIFFAAAALPESIWKRLQALIDKHAQRHIPITSSWGLTEASPLCTSVYFENKIPNNIGLPIPGTLLKLVPNGDFKELRVKGPNVMSGYIADNHNTYNPFDEEGYLCTGDGVQLVEENKPELGLLFKGRVNENFKLQTGTWVNVGELRLSVVTALSPLISDVVICGHNEAYVAILMFPNLPQCQALIGDNADIFTSSLIKDKIIENLKAYNKLNMGRTKQIKRALLQVRPPSLDDNETTDKGYLNQLGVLKNRKADVDRLYQNNNDNDVILLD